jgi:hypothetical protein
MDALESRNGIVVATTPIWGIDHLPTTDVTELWRTAQAENHAETVDELMPIEAVITEPDTDDGLLTLAESIDSLAEERVTLKRPFTVEGIAVKALSTIVAKPFRKVVSHKEEQTLKTQAAIIAESIRTGMLPKKSIRNSSKLAAAALGMQENANKAADMPVSNDELYEKILKQYGLTPAESMQHARGAFSHGERKGKRFVSAAAAAALALLAVHQLRDGGGTAVAEAAATAPPVTIESTTTSVVPPTSETTVTTVPPTTTTIPPTTTAPPATVPPVVYSEKQLGLGKRYSFRLHAEPLEDAAKGLTTKLGEQWDVPTLQAYTGIEPGFIGTTAVLDCIDSAEILLKNETLDAFAARNNTTAQSIRAILKDGEPRMKAGLCLPVRE